MYDHALFHGHSPTETDLRLEDLENWEEEFDLSSENEEPQALPRCCLCCFKFEPYDSFVVFKHRNPNLPDPWTGEYMEPERVEPTGLESAKYRPIFEEGYHPECVHLVAKGLPVGGSVHRAIRDGTSYGVGYTELLPSVEPARVRRLKNKFAQEFMAIIGYRLPLEICENIGRHCLSGYATNLINDVWSNKDFEGPQYASLRVTESSSIWAQHVEFEGLQYVKSLSITRKSESDTKLFEATPGILVSVYFAEDFLGIREVVITQVGNTPSLNQDQVLRWVANHREALPFTFKYRTDGLKLRDLAITKSEDAEANYQQRRWAVLPNDLEASQPDLYPPRRVFGVPNEPTRAVDWNLPGCRGYSVLIDNSSICDIIPHNIGGPSSQLVDVSNEHKGIWFYVPVDQDERIIELWLRIEDHGFLQHFKSLVLRTNKGRSLVLGIERSREPCKSITYQPITKLSLTDPSRMLYCKTRKRMFWLGFEQAMTWNQPAAGISITNPSKSTLCQVKELLSSNAELRGVKEVAVCRDWRYSKDVGIVGMLLTYADGHQRSLGQIRLDYMEAPFTVSSGKIWIGFEKPETEPFPEHFLEWKRKIKWVEADKPLQNINREYLELPLTGSLDWKSCGTAGYWHHSVCHRESSELQDEMDLVLAREAESGGRPQGVVKTFAVVV
ncbi:hypothetical protein FBULB1_9379 [Fusarium bulbicola]|nr:hypothetical protein FBULB1_9379 [Fusarium bulbicola]